jgi:predicted ABC-type transport system involved in lysophospholipase L1 biosynthesis ATPase subunit
VNAAAVVEIEPSVFGCTDLTRTFGSGPAALTAVRGVTCVVAPHDRIALTGPSGSGKSTLLHLMAGLDTATSGTITWPAFDGHPLARPGQVGLVFQGASLIPALTVMENVALPMILGDTTEAEATERAYAALVRFDLGALATKLPEQLSAGQGQRVAIARVLASAPRLILADEPTGQLDHATATLVVDVLLAASADLGAALVVATHDPLVAERLTTQWAMGAGRLQSRHADAPRCAQ